MKQGGQYRERQWTQHALLHLSSLKAEENPNYSRFSLQCVINMSLIVFIFSKSRIALFIYILGMKSRIADVLERIADVL